MRRTETIVDIRDSDVERIRLDFESEGAKVVIEGQPDHYTAVAKFPMPRYLKILAAVVLLIVGFAIWILCAVARN
jgi:hypothetical protein